MTTKDYIDPSQATHVRIFDGFDGYEIDAADDEGNYTERVWTHYNDEILTFDTAKTVAPLFCDEIGRPDLKDKIKEEKPLSRSCIKPANKPKAVSKAEPIKFPDIATDVHPVESAVFSNGELIELCGVVYIAAKDDDTYQSVAAKWSSYVTRRVEMVDNFDYSSRKFYVGCSADCFDPPLYLVPADDLEEAQESLCDYMSKHLDGFRIQPTEYRDYLDQKHHAEFDSLKTDEHKYVLFSTYYEGNWDSEGNPIDDEQVQLFPVSLLSVNFKYLPN